MATKKTAKKNAHSIRKYKKGRLSGYEAATARAVKWYKDHAKKTKAKRAAKKRNTGTGSKKFAKKRYKKVATWAKGKSTKAALSEYRSSFQKHTKKSAARTQSNPGAKLKANISGMKPGYWYDSSLQGAKVKVKRVGQSLIVKPAAKRKR